MIELIGLPDVLRLYRAYLRERDAMLRWLKARC